MDSITYNVTNPLGSSVDIHPVVVDHGISCYAVALLLIIFAMVLILVLYASQLCQNCNLFKVKPTLPATKPPSSSSSSDPAQRPIQLQSSKRLYFPSRIHPRADVVRQSPTNVRSSPSEHPNSVGLESIPEIRIVNLPTPSRHNRLSNNSFHFRKSPEVVSEPSYDSTPSSTSSTCTVASGPRYNTPVSPSEEEAGQDLTQIYLTSDTSPGCRVAGSYTSHSFDFYRLKPNMKHFPGRYGRASTSQVFRSTPEDKASQVPRTDVPRHSSESILNVTKRTNDAARVPSAGPTRFSSPTGQSNTPARPREVAKSWLSKQRLALCHQQTQTEIASVNSLEWDDYGTGKTHSKDRESVRDRREPFDPTIYHIVPNTQQEDLACQSLRTSPKGCKLATHRCSKCNLLHVTATEDDVRAPSNDSGYERPLDLSKTTENDQI